MKKKEKIAWILTGGGAKGAVQLGMIRALAEEKILPDLIAAVSVGAINAVKFLELADNDFSAKNLKKAVREIELVWKKIKTRADIFDWHYAELLDIVRFKKSSIFTFENSTLMRLIDEVDFEKVKKSKVELLIVAGCKDGSGKEFSNWETDRDTFKKALIAAISIPGFSPPIKIGEKYYNDALVYNPRPIGTAARKNANTVYILSCDAVQNPRVAVLAKKRGNWLDNFKSIGDFGSDKISQMEKEWAKRININLKVNRDIENVLDSLPWLFKKKVVKIKKLMKQHHFAEKNPLKIIDLKLECFPRGVEAFKFKEEDIPNITKQGYQAVKKALSKK